MATYNQSNLLDDLLEQTEVVLQKVISQYQLIPHNQFARKPSAGQWSANECLQHLNSYGRYYLPALEDALLILKSDSTTGKFTQGWLGGYFTRLMKPGVNGQLASKMKSPKDHTPKAIKESHEVVSEFIDQQEKMIHLLNTARTINLNKRIVGISLAPAIKLKTGDVFMFVIAHINRHVMQADRALEKLLDTYQITSR